MLPCSSRVHTERSFWFRSRCDDEEDFFAQTLEAVIEAFVLEVALYLSRSEDSKQLSVTREFGLEDNPNALPYPTVKSPQPHRYALAPCR